ncbi:hypothetical protein [Staphylococcus edaphicus]|uniref:hypothetical protein n=1 Tax=Staphylococcus edaphicus TaxID=1955013 RepID=UPI003D2FDEDC
MAKGNKPEYRIKRGLITTHMPNVYFKKWQYITIMLAPLVMHHKCIINCIFIFCLFIYYFYCMFSPRILCNGYVFSYRCV